MEIAKLGAICERIEMLFVNLELATSMQANREGEVSVNKQLSRSNSNSSSSDNMNVDALVMPPPRQQHSYTSLLSSTSRDTSVDMSPNTTEAVDLNLSTAADGDCGRCHYEVLDESVYFECRDLKMTLPCINNNNNNNRIYMINLQFLFQEYSSLLITGPRLVDYSVRIV